MKCINANWFLNQLGMSMLVLAMSLSYGFDQLDCGTSQGNLNTITHGHAVTAPASDEAEIKFSLGSQIDTLKNLNEFEIEIELGAAIAGTSSLSLDLSSGWLSDTSPTTSINLSSSGTIITVTFELSTCESISGFGEAFIVNIDELTSPIDVTNFVTATPGIIITVDDILE